MQQEQQQQQQQQQQSVVEEASPSPQREPSRHGERESTTGHRSSGAEEHSTDPCTLPQDSPLLPSKEGPSATADSAGSGHGVAVHSHTIVLPSATDYTPVKVAAGASMESGGLPSISPGTGEGQCSPAVTDSPMACPPGSGAGAGGGGQGSLAEAVGGGGEKSSGQLSPELVPSLAGSGVTAGGGPTGRASPMGLSFKERQLQRTQRRPGTRPNSQGSPTTSSPVVASPTTTSEASPVGLHVSFPAGASLSPPSHSPPHLRVQESPQQQPEPSPHVCAPLPPATATAGLVRKPSFKERQLQKALSASPGSSSFSGRPRGAGAASSLTNVTSTPGNGPQPTAPSLTASCPSEPLRQPRPVGFFTPTTSSTSYSPAQETALPALTTAMPPAALHHSSHAAPPVVVPSSPPVRASAGHGLAQPSTTNASWLHAVPVAKASPPAPPSIHGEGHPPTTTAATGQATTSITTTGATAAGNVTGESPGDVGTTPPHPPLFLPSPLRLQRTPGDALPHVDGGAATATANNHSTVRSSEATPRSWHACHDSTEQGREGTTGSGHYEDGNASRRSETGPVAPLYTHRPSSVHGSDSRECVGREGGRELRSATVPRLALNREVSIEASQSSESTGGQRSSRRMLLDDSDGMGSTTISNTDHSVLASTNNNDGIQVYEPDEPVPLPMMMATPLGVVHSTTSGGSTEVTTDRSRSSKPSLYSSEFEEHGRRRPSRVHSEPPPPVRSGVGVVMVGLHRAEGNNDDVDDELHAPISHAVSSGARKDPLSPQHTAGASASSSSRRPRKHAGRPPFYGASPSLSQTTSQLNIGAVTEQRRRDRGKMLRNERSSMMLSTPRTLARTTSTMDAAAVAFMQQLQHQSSPSPGGTAVEDGEDDAITLPPTATATPTVPLGSVDQVGVDAFAHHHRDERPLPLHPPSCSTSVSSGGPPLDTTTVTTASVHTPTHPTSYVTTATTGNPSNMSYSTLYNQQQTLAAPVFLEGSTNDLSHHGSQLLSDPFASTTNVMSMSFAAKKENRRTSSFSSLHYALNTRRRRRGRGKSVMKSPLEDHLGSSTTAATTTQRLSTFYAEEVDSAREEKGDSRVDEEEDVAALDAHFLNALDTLAPDNTIGMWETAEHVFIPTYEMFEQRESPQDAVLRQLRSGSGGSSPSMMSGGASPKIDEVRSQPSPPRVRSGVVLPVKAFSPSPVNHVSVAASVGAGSTGAVGGGSPEASPLPVSRAGKGSGATNEESASWPAGSPWSGAPGITINASTASGQPVSAASSVLVHSPGLTFGQVAPEYTVEPESEVPGADTKIAARLLFDADHGVMLLAPQDEVEKYISRDTVSVRRQSGCEATGGNEEDDDDEGGACYCDEAYITKDTRGTDYGQYNAHDLYDHCVYCQRRPALFLCLHCFKAVCPSHVTRHYKQNPDQCTLFLNVLDIMTSFNRIFWCEKCRRFTWRYTEVYDPLVDQIAYTRGTYLKTAARDIHCIGFEAQLKEEDTSAAAGIGTGVTGGGVSMTRHFSPAVSMTDPSPMHPSSALQGSGPGLHPHPQPNSAHPAPIEVGGEHPVAASAFRLPALQGPMASEGTSPLIAPHPTASPMHKMLQRDSLNLSAGNVMPIGQAVSRLCAIGASVQGWRSTQEDAEAAFLVNIPALKGEPTSARETPQKSYKASKKTSAENSHAQSLVKNEEAAVDGPAGGPQQQQEDSSSSDSDDATIPMAVFCVFDGHGGDAVAKLAASQFEEHLRRAIDRARPDDIRARALLFYLKTESVAVKPPPVMSSSVPASRMPSAAPSLAGSLNVLPPVPNTFAGLPPAAGGGTSKSATPHRFAGPLLVPGAVLQGASAAAGGGVGPRASNGSFGESDPSSIGLLGVAGEVPTAAEMEYMPPAKVSSPVVPVTAESLRMHVAADEAQRRFLEMATSGVAAGGSGGGLDHKTTSEGSRLKPGEDPLKGWDVLSNEGRAFPLTRSSDPAVRAAALSPSALVSVPEVEMLRSYFASIMEDALLSLDDYLRETPEGDRGDYNCVGCTACVVGITSNFILCANVGDSGAAFFTTVDMEPISVKHRISDPKEQARIHSAGYSIQNDRVEGMLAVPRALGDFDFKQSGGRGPREQAVIAVPDVTIRPVPSHVDRWGIILACDGVWDTATLHQIHYALTNTANDLDVAASVTDAVVRAKDLLQHRRRGPAAFLDDTGKANKSKACRKGSDEKASLEKTQPPKTAHGTNEEKDASGGENSEDEEDEGSVIEDLGVETQAGVDPQLLTAAAGVFAQCVAPEDNEEGIGLDNCSLIIVERRA